MPVRERWSTSTRFAVQGTSGGGPYALACAVLMPDHVQAVILTSAGGRISDQASLNTMPGDIAEGWQRTWADPEGARSRLETAVTGLRADPLGTLRQMASVWPAGERDWIEKNGRALAGDMTEATRQGAVGWWLDGQSFGQPWPFDATDVRVPIHVFHGDSDSLAPLAVLRLSLAGAPHVIEQRIYHGGSHFAPWSSRENQVAMLNIVPG